MTEPPLYNARLWAQPTFRPTFMGNRYMVSAGHYLAAAAGARILEQGGNACDAGVATGLCINVLEPDMTNLGGVAPICIYEAATNKVETISGLGWWPKRTDPEVFRQRYGGRIKRGVHRWVSPAAADAWLTALERYGTMSFAQVAAPAIELAEDGFAMPPVLFETFADPEFLEVARSWPSTSEVFLRNGEPIPLGHRVVQPD